MKDLNSIQAIKQAIKEDGTIQTNGRNDNFIKFRMPTNNHSESIYIISGLASTLRLLDPVVNNVTSIDDYNTVLNTIGILIEGFLPYTEMQVINEIMNPE